MSNKIRKIKSAGIPKYFYCPKALCHNGLRKPPETILKIFPELFAFGSGIVRYCLLVWLVRFTQNEKGKIMTDLERYEKEGLIKNVVNPPVYSGDSFVVIDRNIMHPTRRRLRWQLLHFVNGTLVAAYLPRSTVTAALGCMMFEYV